MKAKPVGISCSFRYECPRCDQDVWIADEFVLMRGWRAVCHNCHNLFYIERIDKVVPIYPDQGLVQEFTQDNFIVEQKQPTKLPEKGHVFELPKSVQLPANVVKEVRDFLILGYKFKAAEVDEKIAQINHIKLTKNELIREVLKLL